MKFWPMIVSVLSSAQLTVCTYRLRQDVTAEKDPAFWLNLSKQKLKEAISIRANPELREAKNVILFVGDGMGISTVTAARILAGQMKNRNGEEFELAFEKFPHFAFSKTYNVDHQVPDSASTATAYFSGVKTNSYTLGVDARATLGDCFSFTEDMKVRTILDWSQDAGKSTGIVTTTTVTHATPAASYAHSVDRNWEGGVPRDSAWGSCKDIASQLVEDNPDINVIMGGGRSFFFPLHYKDPEVKTATEGREDNKNLVEKWAQFQNSKRRPCKYVWNLTEFNNVNPASTDYLLGLFNPSHMQYELQRDDDVGKEPTLAQMTEKAIQILSKNPKGFFLLVEGGHIDLGHHEGKAKLALTETVAFSAAVERAVTLTNVQNTLIVVTADHSHTMVIAGYAGRGHDILGLSESAEGVYLGADGKPYTTLLYGTGPGAKYSKQASGRPYPSATADDNYRQQAVIPLDTETHSGEDVGIWARGPCSHLFHGVHQQSYIPAVMAFASCVGPDKDSCVSRIRT